MTVVQFKKSVPESALRYRVDLYAFPDGTYEATIGRPDGKPIGVPEELAEIENAVRELHWMILDQGRPNDELLAVVALFGSGLVSTRWREDRVATTPAQRAWLRRRLADVYWQIDERRGWAYRLHQISVTLQLFAARMKGKPRAP